MNDAQTIGKQFEVVEICRLGAISYDQLNQESFHSNWERSRLTRIKRRS